MKIILCLFLCTSSLSWAMENINPNLQIPKTEPSSARTRQHRPNGMTRSRELNPRERSNQAPQEIKEIIVTRYPVNRKLPK